MSALPGTPVTLTAVIPTYNRSGLVVRAIESALAQQRPPDEVIVVDDGSTDDTADLVRGLGGGVRYLRQDNRGGAAARNLGVREARSDWVAFLDSDDVWEPGHLAATERAIAATAGVAGFYFGDVTRTALEGNRRLWDLCDLRIESPHALLPDASEWVMMSRQPMMLQASTFDRKRFLAHGGLREDLTRRHDTHLFLVLGLGAPACAVGDAGARMTADDDTGTRLIDSHDDRSRTYWECTVALYEDVLRRCPLRPGDRAEIQRRLSFAHLRLGRIAMSHGGPAVVAREFAAGVRASPAAFARAVGEGVRRRVTGA